MKALATLRRGKTLAAVVFTGATVVSLHAAEPAVRTARPSTGPLGAFSGALVTRSSEHLLAPQSPTPTAQLARTRTLRQLEANLPRFDSSFEPAVPSRLLEPKRGADPKPLWLEGSRLPRDR